MKISSKTKWLSAGIVFTLATLAFLGMFAMHYRVPAEQAIAAGARVEINLKTGEVKQAPEKIAEEKTLEEKPAENAADKTDATLEEAKTKADELPQEEKMAEKAEEIVMPEAKKAAEVAEAKTEAEPETEVAALPEQAPAATEEKKSQPSIAVVVVGVGLSRSSTEKIMQLPETISFSFSPYASELGKWVKLAQKENHETYIDLPLEPNDYPYSDPGPYALLTGLDNAANKKRLDKILKPDLSFKGVVGGVDERFTENQNAPDWLFSALKEKQLSLTFVARPSNHQFLQNAQKSSVSIIGIDRVIDEKLTIEAIDTALSDAESLAQKTGFAVILARPYPISVLRIDAWLKTLPKKEIVVVPLSHLQSKSPPLAKPSEAKHDSH